MGFTSKLQGRKILTWCNLNLTSISYSFWNITRNVLKLKKKKWSKGRTHFWKRTIQWLFHQNVVLIEQMVSNKKIFMAKFGWDWLSSFRGKDSFKISSPLFLFLALWPSWLEIGITRHYCGRGPSNDHSTKVLLQLAQWFLRRRFLCEFPIGSYVRVSSAVGAILIEGPNRRTHFWKRTIQWLFHQNFVLIEQMVLDKKIFMGISHRVLC